MHFRHVRARLETDRHVIEGTLQLPSEGYRSRMTDFLNAHDADFVPLTDARLTTRDAPGSAEEHAFLAVSARHVVLAVELEELGHFDATGTPPADPVVRLPSKPPPH